MPQAPTPPALPIASALDGCAPLDSLLARMRESNRRLEVVSRLLPPALAQQLRPGPVEGQTWVLFATTNSAAAKLRHWIPAMVDLLGHQGLETSAIRVKVQT